MTPQIVEALNKISSLVNDMPEGTERRILQTAVETAKTISQLRDDLPDEHYAGLVQRLQREHPNMPEGYWPFVVEEYVKKPDRKIGR